MKISTVLKISMFILCFAFIGMNNIAFAQNGHGNHDGHNHDTHNHDGHNHDGHDHSAHDSKKDAHHDGGHDAHHEVCGIHPHSNEPERFDPAKVALHHIADANAIHVLPPNFITGKDVYLPLPCILKAKGDKLRVFMSSKFKIGAHGNGEYALDRYVLCHGMVKRITDESFPMGKVKIEGFNHPIDDELVRVGYQGNCYEAEDKTTWDGGVAGGGVTSFYDFSIGRNVFTMLLVFFFLFYIFRSAAVAYKKWDGQKPQGFWQRILEPMFIFVRDDICKPVIGPRYEEFLPFITSLFFFILGLNLIGQIPFFPGSANVSGSISVTAILAIFTLIVTSINGNGHYWKHIFWMPGVPAPVKLILTPVEVLGIVLKPFTLLVRLFANMTAGHIIVLSFVGLIFVFGDLGAYDWGMGRVGGSIIGIIAGFVLTLFMNAIELLVAFLQAFIFAILSASYIGAAVDEGHH